MKRKIFIGCVIILIVAFISLTIWSNKVSNVEQPKYDVISSSNNIEIRQYSPIIVAEVVTTGDRKTAINQGFRLLADFIFGNNTSNEKIPMTSPVQQKSHEKIVMTAPVQQQSIGDAWIVQFIMPSSYTLDSLPTPNNSAVKIKDVAKKTFAVIKFSGRHTKENLIKHEKVLRKYLGENMIESSADPIYAFYNPPWTLPFMRRNEIMIEVKE